MDDATMKAFLSVGRSVLIVGLLLLSHQVNAETPDEWIALGARVHSGFGALVAVGVKIGLDAVKRLNAGPGDLKVTYYDGDKSPCACAADGIAIATYSSVGQRNLIISPKQAPNEAIAVAVLGLAVNLVSAFLLREEHDDHHHGHAHGSHHPYAHRDNNLRAAYVHVLADAATSVLAIAALVAAMILQWSWADPVVGIIGAVVIASWAIGLVRASGSVLLDVNSDGRMAGLIRERLETRGDRVTDLHLWQIGPGHRAAIVSLISDDPLPPSQYKRRLSGLHGLSHVTVGVETCPHDREGAC